MSMGFLCENSIMHRFFILNEHCAVSFRGELHIIFPSSIHWCTIIPTLLAFLAQNTKYSRSPIIVYITQAKPLSAYHAVCQL